MRWQRLFADLQAEFDEAEAAAARAEDATRRRVETGAVRLVDRLAGALGGTVVLRCSGAGDVSGELVEVGADWLLLTGEGRREVLVATAKVRTVAGLGRATAPAEDPGPVRARLDLRWALRGLARDRSVVQVVLDDGAVYVGTVDGVGADHVELAEHAADQPRRAAAVRGVRAIALPAVAVVRTLTPGLD
ncbi:hypothetical protein SAMN05660209_01155 [Geodermatophilus africanus]|uniref:Fis family transcriptional regulator n=1 Tax=Geodermatophilus africanus TaxID=1137993 RepID=A0A1H3EFQ7_9ACTN|nr:hypothetical protein [Geodermatophilus africanus]SDX76749.1 hypothetical protein SAMN05660209_01155 [Geodermatophilus africanus]